MSIRDFVRKEWRIAREQGLGTAVRAGIGEATMKVAGPLADARSTPIWDADWDICLVLDSCRADTWRTVVDDERWGTADNVAQTAWSVGSASPEWLSKTFADEYEAHWRRAGYVTANPFSGKKGDECKYLNDAVFPLDSRGLGYFDEVWRDQWEANGDLPTVAPETVTDRALWAWQRRDQYSFDRLVVHYMQPHIPFRSRPEWTAGWKLKSFGTGGGAGKDDWHKLRDGDLSADAFWNAYRDNLRWVLNDVDRIIHTTNARVLITSDHGNAAGEWNQWGHPPGSANPAMRRVPWVIVGGTGQLEEVVEPAGNPPVVGGTSTEKRTVTDRLEALGYRQ